MMATYSSPSTDGFFLLGFHWLAWECLRARRGYTHYEIAYWAERRGRARVEQEMRKLTDVQLNTEQGFFVQPIAQIESCFRQCVGTPRQGLLVPASRSVLKLTNNMSPEALDGLEEFSHVWLTFKFHLNTNTLKEAKAFAGAVENSQARMFGTQSRAPVRRFVYSTSPSHLQRYTFTAKITPPMLKVHPWPLVLRYQPYQYPILHLNPGEERHPRDSLAAPAQPLRGDPCQGREGAFCASYTTFLG